MPVSRCARLKNDRRGAEPGPTALLLSHSLGRLLSVSPCFSLSLPSPPSPPAIPRPLCIIPFPSRNDASSFPLRHLKIEGTVLVAPIPPVLLFLRFLLFFFSAFNSPLQDSLDSLGDYVSCYYSSRGTPAHPPSSLTVLPPSLSLLLSLSLARCF